MMSVAETLYELLYSAKKLKRKSSQNSITASLFYKSSEIHGRFKTLLNEFIDTDAHSFYGALERPKGINTELLLESVYQCALASQTLAKDAQTNEAMFSCPLHSAEHDSQQLRYCRRSKSGVNLSLCSNGQELCAACSLRHSQGPLHRCLSPDEERVFIETGREPEGKGLCLLCIRETIEALALARQHSAAASAHTQNRSHLICAPFHNAVGVPGGYRASAIAAGPCTNSAFICAGNVVGSCRSQLAVVVDPETQTAFIDQQKIVWFPSQEQPF